jgi:small subunit ribosomal protein S17
MSDTSDTPSSATRLKGTRLGIVTGDQRDKTCSVSVARQIKHPKYGKYIKRKSSIQVHDPQNASHVGDQVEIVNCRPISKTKSWRLVRIVQAAPGGDIEISS